MLPPMHEMKVPTPKGVVTAHVFAAPQPKGAVLIVAAMGVPQAFYAPFAKWLQSQHFTAVTFDYVGVGESQNGPLSELDVDVLDWAEGDCDAMIETTRKLVPGKPLYWVGHSLGGQLLGLIPKPERIRSAATVACGSGYWKENTAQLRWRVWWLWFFVVPVALRVFGYFPCRRLRKVGDLPRRVMQQWRKWCLHPEYAMAEGEEVRAQFASFRQPLTSFSFTDDEMMSAKNTASLHSFYTGTKPVMFRIDPKQLSERRIGHFGRAPRCLHGPTAHGATAPPDLRGAGRERHADPLPRKPP